MLFIVEGRAGTGKTKFLHNKFRDLVMSGTNKLLFLVPNNATFDTQNAFLDEQGAKMMNNIKVMSFDSLADFILEKSGNKSLSFADDGIKHVVMNMAISSISSELNLFKSRVKSRDLCELMLDTITEFKMRMIEPDQLFDISEKVDNINLKQKLYETGLIYNNYEKLMGKSYFDPLDKLTRATSALDQCDLFQDYIIAVDSHKAFSKQQLNILRSLMNKSKDIYFSICADDSNNELFKTNIETENKLKNIAKSLNIEIGKCEFIPKQERLINADLNSIEENIFRISKTPYNDKTDSVCEYRAQSIYEESDFVARTIRQLIINDDYRYKDIAVISRHPDKYSNILDLYFKKYEIPYFISKSQNIDSKPLFKFVSSIFDIINDNFDKDDILTLLKTGLTTYTYEEISTFENYVFVWEINHRKFFDKFTMNPSGFSKEMTSSDEKILELVEKMRKDLISKLLEFRDACNDSTGKNISKSLMNLLYDLEVDKNINKLANKLEEKDLHSSEELYRSWNLLVDILEKFVYVTKDFKFTKRRYSELLRTYIQNSDISYIPTGIDQVTLYDATNVSFNDRKIIFVVGCNDTEFPNSVFDKGLFSNDECKILDEYDLQISEELDVLSSAENMYAYVALTRATDKLFVSSYNQELSGEVVSESSIFTELELSCTNIIKKDFEETDIYEHLLSENSAFEYFTDKFSKPSYDVTTLENYFRELPKYKRIISSIKENIKNNEKRLNDKELARSLFGKDFKFSASQVDKFYSCKFEYFVKYGLNIKKPKKAVIDSLEYGTLIHYVLEQFIKNHKSNDFSNLDDKEVEKEVSKYLDTYADEYFGGLEDKSNKFIYLYNRMKKTAIALIIHLVKELSQSQFKPVDTELNIGEDIPSYDLKVSDDTTLSLIGKVDRVDLYNYNNETYLRVIDYKTGKKSFNLTDIIYGINLQMFLYMFAITKNGKEKYGDNIIPAGVLYVPANNPSISVEGDSSEDMIEKEKDKELKMHGIVLYDKDIVSAMDKEGKGKYIKVRLTKDGIHSSDKNNVATLEEFGLLSRKIDNLLKDMANNLINGKISDIPIKGRYDECKYCDYKSICNHKDGDKHTVINSLNREEIYERLREGENYAKMD